MCFLWNTIYNVQFTLNPPPPLPRRVTLDPKMVWVGGGRGGREFTTSCGIFFLFIIESSEMFTFLYLTLSMEGVWRAGG